jgi:hypothetical protein
VNVAFFSKKIASYLKPLITLRFHFLKMKLSAGWLGFVPPKVKKCKRQTKIQETNRISPFIGQYLPEIEVLNYYYR